MKGSYFAAFALVGALSLAGCGEAGDQASSATPVSGSNSSATAPDLRIPTQAQPKLQTLKLWIGPKAMTTELALTQVQVMTGMMFRTNMGADDGMLFVFGGPDYRAFWMMNTLVPLSAAYIAPDGTILEIHDMQPHDTNSVVSASRNIQYVLETPQGWFRSNNISPGTVVSTELGPFSKVFTPVR